MTFERGRAWQENVFHFIRILPLWLRFVVLLFFHWGGKEKKPNQLVVFFLGWVFNWIVGHYWELYECFFLVQEFLWLTWLDFFFFSLWKHLRRQRTGCFLPATVCGDSPPPSFKDYQSASEPLSYAARSSLVPEGPWTLPSIYPHPTSNLPRTWQDRKVARKALSAHANYLWKGSTQVPQLSEFRIHQNNISLVFAHLDMILWRNFRAFLADLYIRDMGIVELLSLENIFYKMPLLDNLLKKTLWLLCNKSGVTIDAPPIWRHKEGLPWIRIGI